MISIRQASSKDSISIARLSVQLGYDADQQAIEVRLNDIFSSTHDIVYVSCNDDVVVGWIHAFYSRRVESDAFVEIGGLVVDEDYRNRGIGKRLVKEVENWSKTIGCGKVRVRTNTIRVEAHRFYQGSGFSISKEQKIFDKTII